MRARTSTSTKTTVNLRVITAHAKAISVDHGSYTTPYGATAPWNIPISAGIQTATDSATYSQRLWDIGSNTPGNFNLRLEDFTFPVYETTTATQTRTVNASAGNWATGVVAYATAMQPAPGSDAQMIILNPSTGEEWNFFAISSITGTVINCTRCSRVTVNEDDTGGAANYFTKANGYQPSRGVGIQYFAMLVRPEEIDDGIIRHAMSMPVRHTQCNASVPPATKIENSSLCVATATGIIEGQRYALDVTDTMIDNWFNALPGSLPTKMKDGLRVIGVACRDYGWFITDTSGAAGLQLEARVSASDRWNALDFGSVTASNGKVYPQDALDGLFTATRIYMLKDSSTY